LQECEYDGIFWGKHLGEDCNTRAGVKVMAVGRGKVVYSACHPGSKEKRNWGNVIIIAHKHPKTKKVFFSLYGHLAERLVKKAIEWIGATLLAKSLQR